MFLRKITEHGGYQRCKHIRRRGIDAAHLDKKFQAGVMNQNAGCHHQQITQQLRAAHQLRTRKTDVAAQPKARQKSDGKFEHKRSNVRRERHKAKIDHLRMKSVVVKHKIEYPVERHIQPASKAIAKKIARHHRLERLVEKVDNSEQDGLRYFLDFCHFDSVEQFGAEKFWRFKKFFLLLRCKVTLLIDN